MATSNSIPGRLNFKIKQGDTFRRTIAITTDSLPVALTGATVIMYIDGQEDLTEADGLSTGGADDNEITISKVITWAGKYKYELEVTLASGVIKTYYEGYIKSIAELE